MSEYIDRGKLKQGIAEDALVHLSDWDSGLMDLVMLEIDEIPAADVAPVMHGHFVHDGSRFAGGVDWWHCSNCGGLASGVETQFEYCPWCGAKMDGGADHERETD